MYLAEYLEKRRISQTEFAKITGISKQAICNYLKAKRRPTYRQALLIQKATQGKVSVDNQMDFYEKNCGTKSLNNNPA